MAPACWVGWLVGWLVKWEGAGKVGFDGDRNEGGEVSDPHGTRTPHTLSGTSPLLYGQKSVRAHPPRRRRWRRRAWRCGPWAARSAGPGGSRTAGGCVVFLVCFWGECVCVREQLATTHTYLNQSIHPSMYKQPPSTPPPTQQRKNTQNHALGRQLRCVPLDARHALHK